MLCALALPVAGLTFAAPQAGAAEAQGRAVGAAAAASASVQPAVTRPAAADQALEPVELTNRRTASSETFVNPDGSYRTDVYAAPVHYRDGSGRWLPIENRLVPASQAGYAVENDANGYRLLIPADAGSRPVRVTAGGAWVSFRADGADGVPAVAGSTATIGGLPGRARLEYQATDSGVKETILLPGAPAVGDQPEYTFHLATSAGLTPEVTDDGGLRFLDATGKSIFVSPAPFMTDSAASPDGEPGYSAKVGYRLTAAGDGWTLTVTPDAAWLGDPARVYPVRIDPTLNTADPGPDTWINAEQPTTGNGGGNYLRVGTGSSGLARRALVRFTLPATIPTTATVTGATFSLYLDPGQSRTGNAGDYVVRRMDTHSWTAGATWNTYDGSRAWTSKGGDYVGESGGEVRLDGTSGGYKNWDVTAYAAGWVNEAFPNYGVLVKAIGLENVNNLLGFYSSNAASNKPKLSITYTPAAAEVYDEIGERRFFTYDAQQLFDRLSAKVNVANGNLLLAAHDATIHGTGVDVSLQRYYNSLSTDTADPSGLSAGWVFGDAPTVRLLFPRAGRVTFVGPSGYRVQFDKTTGGDYVRAEPGVDADLSYHADSGTYELVWHNKNTYVFDTATGRLTRQEDKQGNAVSYSYDATSGRIDHLTDTQGRDLWFGWGGGTNPLLEHVTDEAAGRFYDYDYAQFGSDPTWRLAATAVTDYTLDNDTESFGAWTRYSYDDSGRLTTVTDPEHNQTLIGYDGATRRVATLTRVTAATGDTDPITTFTYSSTPAAACDSGAVKSTTVDGPRTDVSDVTTYCLDGNDRVVETIDAQNHRRSSTYTSNSHVVSYNEAASGTAAYSFGYSNDNQTSITLPATPGVTTPGQATAKYQDTANPHLPTEVRDFANDKASVDATWSYTYDPNGFLIEAKNGPEGVTYEYCYDGLGQLQRIDAPPVTVPLDEDTTTGCGTANQGNDTLLSYDAAGNLTGVDEPGSHRDKTFTYDAVSRIRTVTDARGVVSTYHYDAYDRVMEIDYTDPNGRVGGVGKISYDYDEDGNLISRTDAVGTSYFTYDDLNRVATETPAGAAKITYRYDPAGNLTSVDNAAESGSVSYGYDNLNRATSVVDQKGRTTTFGYNDRDQRTRTSYPNGVVARSEYDPARRLRCTYAYKGTAPATSGDFSCPTPSTSLLTFFSYGYTGPGSRDTMTRWSETNRDNQTTSYSYDTIDRLEQAVTKNSAGSTLRSYGYTLGVRSNITKETVTGSAVPNTTTTFDYNESGELCWTAAGSYTTDSCATTPAGATTYSYDPAGNLTGDSTGLAAVYNLAGQMSSVTPPGGSAISMSYADATSDQRVRAGSTQMGYSQLGLTDQGPSGNGYTDWFVRDPDGTLLERVDGSGSNSRDLYYLLDGLGSVTAITDSSGTVVNRYTYEPYGQQINPNSNDDNPLRYAAGYYDQATGMVKFGTRYYLPGVMRWTQPDPVTGTPGNPLTLNPYAYVGCNPINTVDPSGRQYGGCFLSSLGLAASTVSLAAGLLGELPTAGLSTVATYAGIIGLGTSIISFRQTCGELLF